MFSITVAVLFAVTIYSNSVHFLPKLLWQNRCIYDILVVSDGAIVLPFFAQLSRCYCIFSGL